MWPPVCGVFGDHTLVYPTRRCDELGRIQEDDLSQGAHVGLGVPFLRVRRDPKKFVRVCTLAMKTKTKVDPGITSDDGWHSIRVRVSLASLAVLTITGLAITFAGFGPAVQWTVLIHTALGVLTLVPIVGYSVAHVALYRRHALSSTTLLGWLALAGLVGASASGIVLVFQAVAGTRTSPSWKNAHLVGTVLLLAGMVPQDRKSVV